MSKFASNEIILKRGDKVKLNVVGNSINNKSTSKYAKKLCLERNEVGTVVQIIRDTKAWTSKRIRRNLYMVRGPRGESTIFHPEEIQKTIKNKNGKNELPQVQKLSLNRIHSCELHESSDNEKKTEDCQRKIGLTLPIIQRKISYDAVEEREEKEEFNDEWEEDIYESKFDDDNQEERTMKLLKQQSPLKRSQSESDQSLRIAYWRDPKKVAIEKRTYKRKGIDPPKQAVVQRLYDEGSFNLIHITTNDILSGKLTIDNYDILLVPGGYAPNYSSALRGCSSGSDSEEDYDDDGDDDYISKGEKQIIKYVESGGAFVGICAGAYFGSNFGLGLVDVDVVDIENWARGMSQRCWLKYTEEGQEIMIGTSDTEIDNFVVRYANGPLLSINEGSNAMAIAIFQSDFAKKKAMHPGVMADSPAIIISDGDEKRKGRVVLISPHPEDGEPWTKGHFRNLFRWAGNRCPGEILPKKELTLEKQKMVRGTWWRRLIRRDTKKYKPNLKDFGVNNSLKLLCEEASVSRKKERNQDNNSNNNNNNHSKKKKNIVAKNIYNNRMERRKEGTKRTTVLKKKKANRVTSIKKASVDGYSMMLTKKITLPYIECINGPIFLTAPHGLWLAGPRRTHKREKYTSELVMLLSKQIETYLGVPASFMIWNYKTARKMDKRNLDPNYLLEQEWKLSPFHTSLLKFKAKYKDRNIPCFHVDFHGKNNRKKSKQVKIDIGMDAFMENPEEANWTTDDVENVRDCFQDEFDKAFHDIKIGGKQVISDPEPYLSGYWGDYCETTMTHQAVLKGIPSLQLENSRNFRELLMMKKHKKFAPYELIDRYAKVIVEAYRCTVKIENTKGINKTLDEVENDASKSKSQENEKKKEVAIVEQIAEEQIIDNNEKKSSNTTSFFVYGSLRPDDITNMPYRDNWLKGAISMKKGTVKGKMYDDGFACVVLKKKKKFDGIIQGFLIHFPDEMYDTKLDEADEIEGYPEFYDRELTTVVEQLADGKTKNVKAWIYTRNKCSKKIFVQSGDWLEYQSQSGVQANAVKEFIDVGFPVYQGQIDGVTGKPIYQNKIPLMIDQMVADVKFLDDQDPARQV